MPSKFTKRPEASYLHVSGKEPLPEHEKALRIALDRDMGRIYDAHASLNATAIKSPAFGTNFAATSGLNGVTGNLTIATGLSKVESVVASLEAGGGVPLNLWVTAGVNRTNPGSIDIFVWKPTAANDNTPIPETGQVTIHWYVKGQSETTT